MVDLSGPDVPESSQLSRASPPSVGEGFQCFDTNSFMLSADTDIIASLVLKIRYIFENRTMPAIRRKTLPPESSLR